MKTFVALAGSTVSVSILFCPVVMPIPTLPDDVQIVQPDPSLPKELADFFGKWMGVGSSDTLCIVERIDEEKASLYTYRPQLGWNGYGAKVSKERGKYKLWFRGRTGINELT